VTPVRSTAFYTPALCRELYEGYLFLRGLDHAMRLIPDATPGPIPAEKARLRELIDIMEPGPWEGLEPDGLRRSDRRAHRRDPARLRSDSYGLGVCPSRFTAR